MVVDFVDDATDSAATYLCLQIDINSSRNVCPLPAGPGSAHSELQ